MRKIEKWVFLAVAIGNLVPLFAGEFFPTMDGAAHLYNSNLIYRLLAGNKDTLSSFFVFNPVPVPNWTGHVLLAIFNSFLPASIAEKILLVLYLLGLPYAFRGLVKVLDSGNLLFSYLIFPFVYSFVFLLGFYNFSLALIFMLLILRYWIRNEGTLNVKMGIVLGLFFLLLYFSHILVFAVSGLLIVLHILLWFVNQWLSKPQALRDIFLQASKRLGVVILSSAIPLFLSVNYFIAHPPSGDNQYISKSELFDWLITIRPVITYSMSYEGSITRILFLLFLLLILISVYPRIVKFIKGVRKPDIHNHQWRKTGRSNDSQFLLFSSLIILVLYFYLPDSDGFAGFVSVRLGLLFYLILALWLSTLKYKIMVSLASVAVVLFCHFYLVSYYYGKIGNLNKIAVNCNEASRFIPPNSLVLPLKYTEQYMVGNFSNYLGIDKPLVLIKNYECGTGYFPIKWNKEKMPNTLVGPVSMDQVSCMQWNSNLENPVRVIDYIFVLGDLESPLDSCGKIMADKVRESYDLIYSNEHCQLFGIRKEVR